MNAPRLEEVVLARARDAGRRVALVDEHGATTYEQLVATIQRQTIALARGGVREGDLVCLDLAKSADAVTMLLAVLTIGAAYVPLDRAAPLNRIATILRACAPCWLVTCAEDRASVPGLTTRVASLATAEPSVLAYVSALEATPVASATRARSDLAYVIFTSGSTGQPKGVPTTHDSVMHLADWAVTRFGISDADRISCYAPLCFDASAWDIFSALLAGAELHLIPASRSLLPNDVAVLIRRLELTQWHAVPSAVARVLQRGGVRSGDFPRLSRIICGGERLSGALALTVTQRLPHVQLTNVYGPTETAMVSSSHTVDSASVHAHEDVPIGTPVPGKELRVCGVDGELSGSGEIGELWIGGRGVAEGYWRDPERTAQSFCQSPDGTRWYRTGDLVHRAPDGLFWFHGRSDRQVKTSGYRVELDEVALALERLDFIDESAVVAVPSRSGDLRICAAYVADPTRPVSANRVRAELLKELPSYMVPRAWRELGALPRTASGKVDHRALEQEFAGGSLPDHAEH